MPQKYTILWKADGRQSDPTGLDEVRRLGPEEAAAATIPRVSVQTLDDAQAAEAAAAPDVDVIAPSMQTKLIEPCACSAGQPDEPCWGIGAVGALTSRFSGKGVRVAVLDTGIERNHPAFAGIAISEQDFSASGNGDRHGHGTHCAGTIFGRDIGGIRIGVAPGVETVVIGKVLRDDGHGTSDMIFDGLRWAIEQRPNVISMSLGLNFPGQVQMRVRQGWPVELATSQALEDYRKNVTMFEAIMGLARAGKVFGRDPLVVAAAGNESKRDIDANYRIAASLPAVVSDLSVGAVGREAGGLVVAKFSNSNPDVSAPGVGIKSAWIGGGLHTMSGTSMACPHAAGVAALWFEALRGGGGFNSGHAVRSHIVSRARRDVFGSDITKLDIGDGLVTSP